MSGLSSVPCANYEPIFAAEKTGKCQCGYPKEAHVVGLNPSAASAEQGPCASYELDISAENFGKCTCGYPRASHSQSSQISGSSGVAAAAPSERAPAGECFEV